MLKVINKNNKKDVILSAILGVNANREVYTLDRENGKIVVLTKVRRDNKFVAHYDGQKTEFAWLLEAGESVSREWADIYQVQVSWIANKMMRGW